MLTKTRNKGICEKRRLNERYEAWIHDFNKNNLIILEVDELNFVDDPNDLEKVVKIINEKLEKMKMDTK